MICLSHSVEFRIVKELSVCPPFSSLLVCNVTQDELAQRGNNLFVSDVSQVFCATRSCHSLRGETSSSALNFHPGGSSQIFFLWPPQPGMKSPREGLLSLICLKQVPAYLISVLYASTPPEGPIQDSQWSATQLPPWLPPAVRCPFSIPPSQLFCLFCLFMLRVELAIFLQGLGFDEFVAFFHKGPRSASFQRKSTLPN